MAFDVFVDPGLQYGRFAGDCEAMQVKQLRFGGISDSTVEFADISYRAEIEDVLEGGAFPYAVDDGLRAANLVH